MRTSSRAESPVGAAEFFEVEAIEDLAVQVRLDLLVLAPFEGLQVGHKIQVSGLRCQVLAFWLTADS